MTTTTLRLSNADGGDEAPEGAFDPSLSQWMTPSWVAEAIVAHALPDLAPGAVVLEPTCGDGRFLAALPSHVRAIGVEIDPVLAERARATGAEVVTGDIASASLPVDAIDAAVGNPPFRLDVIEAALSRLHGLLPEGGVAAMILPAFAFQTTSRVVRWNARWALAQEMLPRTIFPGIRLPLVLARFVRDPKGRMDGFLLYHESREVEEMPAVYRRALADGRSGWRAVVEAALRRLGGEATVAQICAEIAPRRPTATTHWRAKVRQQLGRHFTRVGEARYSIAA